jgi:hypothetical protein
MMEKGAVPGLDDAVALLRAVLDDSGRETGALASGFQMLARQTEGVLDQATALLQCDECVRALSVAGEVQQLGIAAQRFIADRLQGSGRILSTVGAEAALLDRLSQLTVAQRAIVRETEMLRVLTNIEVARLGNVGAGFESLARELDDFSQAVAHSLAEVSLRVEERRRAVTETRRILTAEVPRMRTRFAEAETSLKQTLAAMGPALQGIAEAPARLRAGAEAISAEIAGVVAGIQSQDITRQQIEHVCSALALIGEMQQAAAPPGEARAGLTVQRYQVEAVRTAVRSWTAQIRGCLAATSQITADEVTALGPGMLTQERALAAQLDSIERLQRESLADTEKVRASLAGVTGLMELVGEHLHRSKAVRDRLQLLMFNSIIEASHLGHRADGIVAISTTINRISQAWSALTGKSEEAMREIAELVRENAATLETFAGAACAALREAQARTRSNLGILREAARSAESRGGEIERATAGLQKKTAEIEGADRRLEACFDRLEAVAAAIAAAEAAMSAGTAIDAAAIERRFATAYTTEREREILRAALSGGPLPATQESFTGNGVELF